MIASIGECFGGFGWIIVVVIFVLGTRQWCKWFKQSPALRGAAKRGFFTILGRMFK